MRVLIYAHDTFGMGHISRALKLAAVCTQIPNTTVLIVTGTAVPNLKDVPACVDLIKLPSLRSVHSNMSNEPRFESFNTPLDGNVALQIRRGIINALIKDFQPDLFIVDLLPKGVEGELVSAIRHARKYGTQICLSLRDILGDPESVIEKWQRQKYVAFVQRYFDRVLVFGDRNVLDVVQTYNLESIAEKISYMGYLVAQQEDRQRGERILVTVGGGRDGMDIITSVVRNASKDIRKRLLVVTGPLAPENQCALPEDVQVMRETPDLTDLMRRQKMVICMGGYNTLCEVIETKTPAIVIPRSYPETEQLIRAERFEKRGIIPDSEVKR